MKFSNKKFILGSKSPRRSELLRSIGIDFEIRTKDTDENYLASTPPEEVAVYVAKLKARALQSELKDNEVLICADTVVIVDAKVLGKPADRTEAIEMLQLLSGKTHQVITGVVVSTLQSEVSSSTCTEVTFKELSDQEIGYYVDHFKPFDKAGAYGIQEWIGYIGVTEIKGSYFNVVGLPIHEVYRILNAHQ